MWKGRLEGERKEMEIFEERVIFFLSGEGC